MEKLKQIIESTLINKVNPNYTDVEFNESVKICSDYIAQEIKDIAIEFAVWRNNLSFSSRVIAEGDTIRELSEEELFNQFINDKYKE